MLQKKIFWKFTFHAYFMKVLKLSLWAQFWRYDQSKKTYIPRFSWKKHLQPKTKLKTKSNILTGTRFLKHSIFSLFLAWKPKKLKHQILNKLHACFQIPFQGSILMLKRIGENIHSSIFILNSFPTSNTTQFQHKHAPRNLILQKVDF